MPESRNVELWIKLSYSMDFRDQITPIVIKYNLFHVPDYGSHFENFGSYLEYQNRWFLEIFSYDVVHDWIL